MIVGLDLNSNISHISNISTIFFLFFVFVFVFANELQLLQFHFISVQLHLLHFISVQLQDVRDHAVYFSRFIISTISQKKKPSHSTSHSTSQPWMNQLSSFFQTN